MKLADVPGFAAWLLAKDKDAARALLFIMLTAARSGEVRGAGWEERCEVTAERLVSFDNAHAVTSGSGPGTKRPTAFDHRHRLRALRPYDERDCHARAIQGHGRWPSRKGG